MMDWNCFQWAWLRILTSVTMCLARDLYVIVNGHWDDCALTSRIDLNGDCVVDLYELSQMAQNWL